MNEHVMATGDVLQQLFKTNDPQGLFAEIYNKSFDYVPEKNQVIDETAAPVMVRKANTPVTKSNQYVQTQQRQYIPEQTTTKNQDVLKGLLGERYFNQLQNKTETSGSIFESVVKNIPDNSNFDYEVEETPRKQQPTSNTLSLNINGKIYEGRIVQNKKKQILFMISSNQCFILTPSDLKSVTKK